MRAGVLGPGHEAAGRSRGRRRAPCRAGGPPPRPAAVRLASTSAPRDVRDHRQRRVRELRLGAQHPLGGEAGEPEREDAARAAWATRGVCSLYVLILVQQRTELSPLGGRGKRGAVVRAHDRARPGPGLRCARSNAEREARHGFPQPRRREPSPARRPPQMDARSRGALLSRSRHHPASAAAAAGLDRHRGRADPAARSASPRPEALPCPGLPCGTRSARPHRAILRADAIGDRARDGRQRSRQGRDHGGAEGRDRRLAAPGFRGTGAALGAFAADPADDGVRLARHAGGRGLGRDRRRVSSARWSGSRSTTTSPSASAGKRSTSSSAATWPGSATTRSAPIPATISRCAGVQHELKIFQRIDGAWKIGCLALMQGTVEHATCPLIEVDADGQGPLDEPAGRGADARPSRAGRRRRPAAGAAARPRRGASRGVGWAFAELETHVPPRLAAEQARAVPLGEDEAAVPLYCWVILEDGKALVSFDDARHGRAPDRAGRRDLRPVAGPGAARPPHRRRPRPRRRLRTSSASASTRCAPTAAHVRQDRRAQPGRAGPRCC